MLNVSSLDDKADNLRLMAPGICLMTVGEWLDFVLVFCVDEKWRVVLFSVLLEESVRQVECDIEVVN